MENRIKIKYGRSHSVDVKPVNTVGATISELRKLEFIPNNSSCVFVAKNGSDSNSGSKLNPVQSLEKAMSLCNNEKSKVIVLDSGEYYIAGGILDSNCSGWYASEGELPSLSLNCLNRFSEGEYFWRSIPKINDISGSNSYVDGQIISLFDIDIIAGNIQKKILNILTSTIFETVATRQYYDNPGTDPFSDKYRNMFVNQNTGKILLEVSSREKGYLDMLDSNLNRLKSVQIYNSHMPVYESILLSDDDYAFCVGRLGSDSGQSSGIRIYDPNLNQILEKVLHIPGSSETVTYAIADAVVSECSIVFIVKVDFWNYKDFTHRYEYKIYSKSRKNEDIYELNNNENIVSLSVLGNGNILHIGYDSSNNKYGKMITDVKLNMIKSYEYFAASSIIQKRNISIYDNGFIVSLFNDSWLYRNYKNDGIILDEYNSSFAEYSIALKNGTYIFRDSTQTYFGKLFVPSYIDIYQFEIDGFIIKTNSLKKIFRNSFKFVLRNSTIDSQNNSDPDIASTIAIENYSKLEIYNCFFKNNGQSIKSTSNFMKIYQSIFYNSFREVAIQNIGSGADIIIDSTTFHNNASSINLKNNDGTEILKNLIIYDNTLYSISADNQIQIKFSCVTGILENTSLGEGSFNRDPLFVNDGYANVDQLDLNLQSKYSGSTSMSPCLDANSFGRNMGAYDVGMSYKIVNWSMENLPKPKTINKRITPVNPIYIVASDGTPRSEAKVFSEIWTFEWDSLLKTDFENLNRIVKKAGEVLIYLNPGTKQYDKEAFTVVNEKEVKASAKHFAFYNLGVEGVQFVVQRPVENEEILQAVELVKNGVELPVPETVDRKLIPVNSRKLLFADGSVSSMVKHWIEELSIKWNSMLRKDFENLKNVYLAGGLANFRMGEFEIVKADKFIVLASQGMDAGSEFYSFDNVGVNELSLTLQRKVFDE